MCEFSLYDIMKMRVGTLLNAFYLTLLQSEIIFLMVFLRFIIKMRDFVWLNALYMILLK